MHKQFLAFLLFLSTACYAQTSSLDEFPLDVLREKLAVSTDDTITVQLQLALGHLMLLKAIMGPKDVDSAVRFAAQADVLSHRINYDFGIINAMLLNTETLYKRNDSAEGLKVARKALAYSEAHNNIDGQARSYYLISQYYPSTDPITLEKRLFYTNKAIDLFKKAGNINLLSFILTKKSELLFQQERTTEGLRSLFEALNLGKGVSRRTVEGIYWNIGVTSLRLGDYTNALKYNLLALKTAMEVKDTSIQLCLVYRLIASTYIKMQDYSQAIPYSLKVLELAKRYNATDYIRAESTSLAIEYTHTNQLSKALEVLNEMKSNARNDIDKLSVTVEFLNNLTYSKSLVEADQYAQTLKEMLPKIPRGNETEIMNAYNSLASYYTETGQTKQAYHYTELYSAMAHKLNYITGIHTAENQYYKLVTLKGDFRSASRHLLKEKEIRDSIDNIVKAYQISLLDMENETLEKNTHIDSLTEKTQLNEIKLKRHQLIQNVTIGGSVMLLIITGLIYSRYRLKQRSNRNLEAHQKELDQKNLFLETMNGEQDKLLKEKEWLIREVHHRVKNNLQMVTSLLNTQTAYLQDEAAVLAVRDSLRRMQAMSFIHQKLYKEENISTIAMPKYIDELVCYLQESFDTGSRIIFEQSISQVSLDISQVIPLGLIINESIVNAIKYAFPNGQEGIVNIQLHRESNHLVLRISDNGIGLPAGVDLKTRNSLGFDLMHGLTKQLNGNLIIENNNGVQVIVRFLT
jgi:two-component sensor histidine kinase